MIVSYYIIIGDLFAISIKKFFYLMDDYDFVINFLKRLLRHIIDYLIFFWNHSYCSACRAFCVCVFVDVYYELLFLPSYFFPLPPTSYFLNEGINEWILTPTFIRPTYWNFCLKVLKSDFPNNDQSLDF